MSDDICSPNVGPYCGVFLDRTFEKGGHKLRLVGYRSFNAYGLYGSEYNGFAILSDTDKSVVADEYDKASSGYAIDVGRMSARADEVEAMTADQFCEYLTHTAKVQPLARLRYIPEMETEKYA
jgi:hypothetical protein